MHNVIMLELMHNTHAVLVHVYCWDIQVCVWYIVLFICLCSYVKNAHVCQTIQSRVTSHLSTLCCIFVQMCVDYVVATGRLQIVQTSINNNMVHL